jgi:hypothetical protein
MDGLTLELVKQLDTVERIHDLEIYRGEKGQYNWIDIENRKVKQISELASWVIFTDRGYVNFENIRDIKAAGYPVFQVEVDPHYGWVSAGIEIPDLGVIVVYNDNLDNRWRKGN